MKNENALVDTIAAAIAAENADAIAAADAERNAERAETNAAKLFTPNAETPNAETENAATINETARKKAIAAETENAAKLYSGNMYGFFRALHETENNRLYYSIVSYEQIAENGEKLLAYAVCRINPFALVAKSERDKATSAAKKIADYASARNADYSAVLALAKDIVNALCVKEYAETENGKKALVKNYADCLRQERRENGVLVDENEHDARDIYENAYKACENGKHNAAHAAALACIVGKLYRMVNKLPRNVDARAEKRTQSAYAAALKAYNAANNRAAQAHAAADAAAKLAADAAAAINAAADADAIENAAKLARKAKKASERAAAADADARAKKSALETARAAKLAAAAETENK